jgi:dihydrodipicolinate synthase/N-acetylneuraminate lyase
LILFEKQIDFICSSSAGCSGGINGLAAVLGEPLCKMHALAMDGQWQKALELQRKLVNIDLLVNY